MASENQPTNNTANWWKNSQFVNGLGNIAGGLFGMFGESNPANAAQNYLNQIPGEMGQYLNPYIQNGNSAYPFLQNYMNRGDNAANLLNSMYPSMIANPGQFMNQMGQGFQKSPGYDWQTSQALGAANRAAAAGGMAGSPAEQQQIAGVTNQLANQDYYNYLNHAMNIFGTGVSGLNDISNQGLNTSQNIYNTGYNASSDLASSLASYLMSQGNFAYAGGVNQNEGMLGGLGALASGIGDIANFF